MRVLVVDDEPLARQRLARLLAVHPEVEVVGEAGNGEEALALYQQRGADLLLLDIAMPGMDGISLARRLARLQPAPAVVFCTAYDEHAIAAFEARAVAYLLKPISAQRLQEVLANAGRLNQAQLSAMENVSPPTGRQQLSVRGPQGLSLLPVASVRYFIADQKYVTAVHPGGSVLLDESLKELETEFAGQLMRVHRNALVARRHLCGLQRSGPGSYRVLLQDIERGPLVSRRHLAAVRASLADKA